MPMKMLQQDQQVDDVARAPALALPGPAIRGHADDGDEALVVGRRRWPGWLLVALVTWSA